MKARRMPTGEQDFAGFPNWPVTKLNATHSWQECCDPRPTLRARPSIMALSTATLCSKITFSAASTAVRDATIRAFIIASATAGATFDVSLSTARSREAYAEAIAVWKETLPSRYVKRKGTHEILPALVDEYNVRHERLVQAASDVMAASGLQRLMDSRPAVLKALGSIEAFLLPSDRRAAARLRDILSGGLNAYSRSLEGTSDDPLTELMDQVATVQSTGPLGDSELAACLATPIAAAVGRVVQEHHVGYSARQAAAIWFGVTKPAAVVDGSWVVECQLRNDGHGPATEIALKIVDETLGVDRQAYVVPRLLPAETWTWQVTIAPRTTADTFELPYEVRFTDRLGTHVSRDRLRLTRQRPIDWSRLEDAPSPYSLSPVAKSDVGRLQGRDELLRQLRRGVRDRGSFVITGQRRVGKTSLVQVFIGEFSRQDTVLAFTMPLGQSSLASGVQDLGRVGRDLADRLVEEYDNRFQSPSPVPAPAVEEFRESPSAVFGKFLRIFAQDQPASGHCAGRFRLSADTAFYWRCRT